MEVIDIRLLRDDPDLVRNSQRARGEDEGVVDVALAADGRRRSALAEFESLRAQQKARSKDVGALMGAVGRARTSGDAAALAVAEEAASAARAAASQLSVGNPDRGRASSGNFSVQAPVGFTKWPWKSKINSLPSTPAAASPL